MIGEQSKAPKDCVSRGAWRFWPQFRLKLWPAAPCLGEPLPSNTSKGVLEALSLNMSVDLGPDQGPILGDHRLDHRIYFATGTPVTASQRVVCDRLCNGMDPEYWRP